MQDTDATARTSRRGVFIVITGDGKGKTTAAFGQALRAAGHGLRVAIIQFMKGRVNGEAMAVQKIPEIKLFQYGQDTMVVKGHLTEKDIEAARYGLQKAKELTDSGQIDLLILDEINVAVDYRLVEQEEVLKLVLGRPEGMDLIFTGRNASDEIIELADTVSEIKSVKHHYDTGTVQRAGMEY